ncbi:MAG: UDP-N-acetylglucosamine acyltransferase [Psychrosphaera sp.]|uniref:Acyl-[acyl-carrier-protein]--UDP-N-acetylglucosamine O-acyltransferase n=1 Tax=Psychrosphaera aquimarina TaxID=2044854 RepID=A0ABU3QZW7_9GAMM|nr:MULTISPECIES: acyl-ACP--UDP-N-acetylglucosamine O-acyltransferase [Psychrosphaera]MBU2917139.1 acyl-ACP--UDP-N-acetylglucosamine O-acyltransferase [Psychrosphaera sp. F3M07]MDU0112974.1 acyl-ACP--UDP-N-acetylglucosamine O-acyltransferase [Psychrosphaera aquimarina]
MIHETAIVSPSAKLGKNVYVGPWSFIGDDVEIGDDTIIHSHVVVKGPTIIGANNIIFQFSSVGEDCQDKKYNGEPTRLEIGDNNIIRENVTIHRGTIQDQSLTKIGSNNLFMAYVHVAHDCVVGNNTIFANNASIAGHVHVGDWAILGGMVGVHQFCHIGAHSFCGLNSMVVKDVPPYVLASGQSAKPHGINSEGLKRRGFSAEDILAIKRAYKEVYRKGNSIDEALANIPDSSDAISAFKQFIIDSPRGIVR